MIFLDTYNNNVKKQLIKGWNTWNTRSVLSYVYMPQCFSVSMGIKEYRNGLFLREALIGRFEENSEKIFPVAHSYDGSYVSLKIEWEDIVLNVETASEGDSFFAKITPLKTQLNPPSLILETGFLWGRQGDIKKNNGKIIAKSEEKCFSVYSNTPCIVDLNVPTQTPCLSLPLKDTVYFCINSENLSDEQIEAMILSKKELHTTNKEKYGELSEAYDAMQTCLAFDTIYDPSKDRVVSTVSRLWNVASGGCIVFCWDNYFAGIMAGVDNKLICYSNIVEITREISESGFVPNCSWGNGFKSLDRSQPPVGSIVLKNVYEKYREKWIINEIFDSLFKWNSWFFGNRRLSNGCLTWGSNPYEVKFGNKWEIDGVNDRFGAALESGLDNSPMYDNIEFDKQTHLLKLCDVGLTSLYSADCNALAFLALETGHTREAEILKEREASTSKALDTLWDEKAGIFKNKHTDTGEFSSHLSPTLFYPLLDKNVKAERINRMIEEHFYNPEEFWGEYILPSISKNNAAYLDQNYWRGRIWAPLNFLVYLSMKEHNLTKPCRDICEKSLNLILKEWLEMGHVHENYSSLDGYGCGKENSDKFYHWGGLLSLIALIEHNYF